MGEEWWFWPAAEEVRVTREAGEIEELLRTTTAPWTAIALRFDAAPAFDPAYRLRSSEEPEWLAIALDLGEPEKFRFLESAPLDTRIPTFQPAIDREDYGQLFRTVRAALAAGDSYQVNGTFPLRADWQGDAAAIFSLLCGPTPPPYATFFHSPTGPILSLSPELFFERRGESILSRPMKGTRPHDGLAETATELGGNPKDQAENLMIVDMIRNDLGRVAETGSVHVPHLFDVEDHGTVWQMTSTVTARTRAGLADLFKALFPCASIVGAPKVETMRLISEVESWQRGIYTGAIGLTSADFDRFSVAIRTIETDGDQARYGVGSGIVWDSDEEEEWRECLAKAKILQPYGQKLGLIETLRWEPDRGYLYADRHLKRLRASAGALNLRCPEELPDHTGSGPERVRLLLTDGFEITSAPLDTPFCDDPKTAATIDASPVKNLILSDDPWLRHKTTLRRTYDLALRIAKTEEALLINERGEATEFTIGNLVCQIGDRLFTPPVECGLLPGVYREELLAQGRLEERSLTIDEVLLADAIYRINSVRGFIQVRLYR